MTLQEPKRRKPQHRVPYGAKRPKTEELITPRKLIEMRTRAGLSQSELARRLGQLRQTVYKWEAGLQRVPPHHYETILTVCAAAKVEYDALRVQLLTTF